MHALYRFYAADGELLYVGITNNPPRRFTRHKGEKDWWIDVARIDLQQCETREELAEAERAAIRDERPRFNIVGALTEVAAEADETEGEPGLVGRWFHSYETPEPGEDTSHCTLDDAGNKLVWQGIVVGREGPMLILQLFSWWDGHATNQVIHPLDDMRAWKFFESSQAMQISLGCSGDFGRDRGGKCGAPCTHVIRDAHGIGPIYRCHDCIKFYSGTVETL